MLGAWSGCKIVLYTHSPSLACPPPQVYDTTAMEVVDSSLQGYNATVFAYGQTVRESHCHVSFDDRELGTPRSLTQNPSKMDRSICSGEPSLPRSVPAHIPPSVSESHRTPCHLDPSSRYLSLPIDLKHVRSSLRFPASIINRALAKRSRWKVSSGGPRRKTAG